MELKREKINKKIAILDNNVVLLELYFVPSFFLFVFHTNKSIIIDKNIDETFYYNLEWLMNNSYDFSHKHSKKSDSELIWLSEQCYNIENEEECDMTSRLIIRKNCDSFQISYHNPFFEKYDIERDGIIGFSPAGNGFFSRNNKTDTTLQDDIIYLFYSTLNEEVIEYNKTLKK